MKFACLCLGARIARDLFEGDGQLPAGFVVKRPVERFDLSTWRDEVGRWQIDQICAANVQVWATAESERLDVLDGENQELTDRIHLFWKGLLLSRPPLIHSAWILSGALKGGTPDVRMFTKIDRMFVKEPHVPVDISRLRDAAETADHLRCAFADGLHGRIERGLTAFLGSMSSRHIDESILALVRAFEGILHPADKAQFVKRACQVVTVHGESAVEVFEELYDVRSGFTHAEPLEVVFPDKTRDEALQRGQQLQSLLYFAVSRTYRAVLADRNLVERFSKEGQGEYWGKVVAGKKKPPFEVEVQEDEWLFKHWDTSGLHGTSVLARRSDFALQRTNPSQTLGPTD